MRMLRLLGIEISADLHHLAALTRIFATALSMVDAELSTLCVATLIPLVNTDGVLVNRSDRQGTYVRNDHQAPLDLDLVAGYAGTNYVSHI